MADCKILIIDGDGDDVGVLSEAFTQCGVESVHYVFTAVQAFCTCTKEYVHLPKLIVTDHLCPV
jgi:CheY-like chemotaxis protein